MLHKREYRRSRDIYITVPQPMVDNLQVNLCVNLYCVVLLIVCFFVYFRRLIHQSRFVQNNRFITSLEKISAVRHTTTVSVLKRASNNAANRMWRSTSSSASERVGSLFGESSLCCFLTSLRVSLNPSTPPSNQPSPPRR